MNQESTTTAVGNVPALLELPAQARGWNWGAFSLGLPWGVGHRVYSSFWLLVPLVNIAMLFVLGAKGSEWAWAKGRYSSVEEFEKEQATWNRAGRIFFFINLLIIIPACIGILATLVITQLGSAKIKTRDAIRKSDISLISSAIVQYESDHNGVPPITLKELQDSSGVKGASLSDPSGKSYEYTQDGTSYTLKAHLQLPTECQSEVYRSVDGTLGCQP